MDKKEIGNAGESAVCRYLRLRGYKVVCRNFKTRFGEIDIIAQKGKIIAFVEVKTRKENSRVSGVDAVGAKKQQCVITAATEYLQRNRVELQPRFDVAEVTDKRKMFFRFNIKYIENAF